MSSTQHTASPRGPRAKHQHSKSGTQVQPNTNGNGKQSQRRPKGNRTNNGVNGTPQKGGNAAYGSPGKTQANALDPSFTDSAVVSSEDVPIPTGPRYKKHTQSQPAVDRVFSPTSIAAAALTDSELPVKNPSATPVKQAAYAGPTFHASPAPSALPIPKFLSKSVPAKSFAEPPTPPEDGSESASPPTPSRASPSRAPIAVPERREFSPLNMLFKADAEEKARNANASPASLTLSNSPNQTPARHQLHHSKHNSQSSMTALFPIELDAESKPSHPSPPLASLSANRSITAPGKIPQVGDSAGRQNDPVVQELLNRLNQTKNPPTSTPPRTLNRVPSEPSSRHQTPSPHNDGRSPFRSASGPTTPAPPGPEQSSDLFYGNQANLSPLFKAAKTDSSKRNSGLRTEITADSPVLPQNGFAPISPPPRMDPNAVSRGYLAQALGGPLSPRRGSAPQVQPYGGPPYGQQHPAQPYGGSPSNQRTRTPGKRSYQPRPDSYPHVNSSGAVKANAIPPAKTNPFIPSSVQAKKYSSPPTKAPDHSSLEDDLKRMLNVKVSGDTTSGVQ